MDLQFGEQKASLKTSDLRQNSWSRQESSWEATSRAGGKRYRARSCHWVDQTPTPFIRPGRFSLFWLLFLLLAAFPSSGCFPFFWWKSSGRRDRLSEKPGSPQVDECHIAMWHVT